MIKIIDHKFKQQSICQILSVIQKCELSCSLASYTETSAYCKFELLPGNERIRDILKFEDEFQNTLGVKTVLSYSNGRINIIFPKPQKELFPLSKILESDFYNRCPGILKIGIGEDTDGRMVIGDLAKWVNVLIAGEPGSGKSIFLHGVINSLIQKYEPDHVRLILADSKRVELTQYENIRHLQMPVLCSQNAIRGGLEQLTKEMEKRYELFRQSRVRDIKGYNDKYEQMPYLILIVDELANIVLKSKQIEELIVNLAQMGRAAGIHLVLATQKPSSDVITTLLKSNIGTRISFEVASRSDSQVIIDENGAEELSGKGDMLIKDYDGLARVQGAYISDEEIEETVNNLIDIEQVPEEQILLPCPDNAIEIEYEEPDKRYEKLVEYIMQKKRCNAWTIKQFLHVGNTIANEMLAKLQADGIISKEKVGISYEVLISESEDNYVIS